MSDTPNHQGCTEDQVKQPMSQHGSICRLTHHALAIENSPSEADWPEVVILPSSGVRAPHMDTQKELHTKQSASSSIQSILTSLVYTYRPKSGHKHLRLTGEDHNALAERCRVRPCGRRSNRGATVTMLARVRDIQVKLTSSTPSLLGNVGVFSRAA